jgi:hypothetical protein
MLRHRFVADDIGNRHPATALEHAVHLGEQLSLIFRPHQVEHTVGDDNVDGIVGDQRQFAADLGLKFFEFG